MSNAAARFRNTVLAGRYGAVPTAKDMTRPQPPRERTGKELRAIMIWGYLKKYPY